MQEMEEYKKKAHVDELLAQEQARELSIREELADELARYQQNFLQLRKPEVSLDDVRHSMVAYVDHCKGAGEKARTELVESVLGRLREACVMAPRTSPYDE